MKKYILISTLLFTVFFSQAQEIDFFIQGNYNRSITKEQVRNANTLKDINDGFPSSWIKKYNSVILTVTSDQVITKLSSNSATLSPAQKTLLKKADFGTEIVVDIEYVKKNYDDAKEIRNINFSYTIVPAKESQFPGGQKNLESYISENLIAKMSKEVSDELQMELIFIVDEQGKVSNITLSKSSDNQSYDEHLLKAIREMPKWTPAQDAFGNNVQQEFKILVGNMIGC